MTGNIPDVWRKSAEDVMQNNIDEFCKKSCNQLDCKKENCPVRRFAHWMCFEYGEKK